MSPLSGLEFLAISVRMLIIFALVALLFFSGRIYAAIRHLEVEVVKPYFNLTKYLFIFVAILCFLQIFWLLQWMHTWGLLTLPLSTSELGIIGSFNNVLFVVGTVPIIFSLFTSHFMFRHLARSLREGIILDIRTLHNVKGRLSKIYGSTSQPILWYAMGKEAGQRKATDAVKRLPNDTPEVFIARIFRLQQILNWGRFEVVSTEPNKFVVHAYNCAEQLGVKGETPHCDFVAGFLAGIYETTYGLDAETSEVKCASQGNPYCEFHIVLGELPK